MKDLKTGDKIEVMLIALILRENEDDKIVAVDETMEKIKKCSSVDESEEKLILDYFGFRHKIISVENSKSAVEYITK